MAISFRPGIRENVGLWINLIAGTGGGKTFTAMRLASGIAGDRPFAVIDTENRRALHYGDRFRFDHAELRAPFTPAAYAEAIVAADAAGYPVIVIDSGSHVWAGNGGVLDMQEAEHERLGGRENTKMLSWSKPKGEHKRMVGRMLQVQAHIILCLRAEPKIEMVKDASGKMVVQAKQSLTGLDGWIPVCDKNLPFEATVSFLLMADRPGIPHPIKLQEQHREIFPDDRLIDEEAGRRLAVWAAGGAQNTIAERVAACTSQEQLNILWDSLTASEAVKATAALFKARAKEINGAVPHQQPQGGETRESHDQKDRDLGSDHHGSHEAPPEAGRESSLPGFKEAVAAIDRRDYDLAADIARHLPEVERLDIEHKLSLRTTA